MTALLAAPIARAAFGLTCLIVACVIIGAPLCVSAQSTNASGAQATPAPTPASPGPNATTNPFPSASPTPTPGPIGNGFAIVGFSTGNASGGVIPSPVATGAPPLPSSNSSGFFIDLAGRLSRVYTATVSFGDSVLHGGDQPVVTFSYGGLYYTPSGGAVGVGIGYESLQRSSNTSSANEFGAGVVLLPDLRHHVSPYAGFAYYPSAHTQGASAAITAYQAGIALAVSRPGIVVKLGYTSLSYPNPNTSPTSVGNAVFGIGASF